MKLRKPIFLLRSLLLSGMAVLTACGRNDTATLEGELDYMIRNKRLFDEKKEERIDGFRRMLCMTRLTPEQEYAINDSLSEVFYKYRLDSAIRYGERNLELARRLAGGFRKKGHENRRHTQKRRVKSYRITTFFRPFRNINRLKNSTMNKNRHYIFRYSFPNRYL